MYSKLYTRTPKHLRSALVQALRWRFPESLCAATALPELDRPNCRGGHPRGQIYYGKLSISISIYESISLSIYVYIYIYTSLSLYIYIYICI